MFNGIRGSRFRRNLGRAHHSDVLGRGHGSFAVVFRWMVMGIRGCRDPGCIAPDRSENFSREMEESGPIFIERTQVEFASILAVFCGAGLLVGFASFQELHSHYFALLSPFFAVIGVTTQKIGAGLVHKPGHRKRRFGAGVLLLAFACTPVGRQEFSCSAWESESTQMGESVAYPWAEESVEDEVT